VCTSEEVEKKHVEKEGAEMEALVDSIADLASKVLDLFRENEKTFTFESNLFT
jgi:hypothetical protein